MSNIDFAEDSNVADVPPDDINTLGWESDIRRVAVLITSASLIVTGNYLPKFDRLNGIKTSADKARKMVDV